MTRDNAGAILLAATAFVGFLVFSKRKAIALLNYFIAGVAIGMDGTTPILRVSIGIQNPSNEDFQIKSFVGNLFTTDNDGVKRQIGNVSSFETLWVRAASQVTYPLYIRLNIIPIVTDLVNAIMQGSGFHRELKLEGTVNASGIVAPITVVYQIF